MSSGSRAIFRKIYPKTYLLRTRLMTMSKAAWEKSFKMPKI